jgi:general secretion pathway protein G
VRAAVRQAQAADSAAAVATLGAALDAFATDGGRYPTNSEGLSALIYPPQDVRKWNGPYLRSPALATDPWGSRYSYTETGGAYRVASPGPDGKPGTSDDITASGPPAGSPLPLPR